ncbi:hypothetical protein FHU40_004408 [Nocardioides soli]|uniref:Uncharacterized protein n=1 Tax=Nocardioides soli TaxID=1036020 RepID=A0A7W4VZB1_9ACTN|nr:hypothetical protein [Nocardioides soli]MBB3044571.1 hypothetical protein [Nocardioides soli]
MQHQDGCRGGERAGQAEPLALAAGEGGSVDGHRLVGEVVCRGRAQHLVEPLLADPARGVDVAAQGALEEVDVVLGHDQQPPRLRDGELGQGHTAEQHRTAVGHLLAVQQPDQGARVGGILGHDGDDLAARDARGDVDEGAGDDAVELEVGRDRGAIAGPHERRSGEHAEDAPCRRPRPSELGDQVGDHPHRLGDELGQAHDGDQLADAHPAVERPVPGDQRDDREEGEAEPAGQPVEQPLPASGGDAGAHGVLALPAVARVGHPLGADALERAQAAHQVGRQPGRSADRLLALVGTVGEPGREHLGAHQHHRDADEHDHRDQRVDRGEHDRADHQAGGAGDREGQLAHDSRDQLGVPGRKGEHVARQSVGPRATGRQHVGRDLGAQQVALLLDRPEADPRPEPVGEAQHREVHAQHGAPQHQSLQVAGGDGPVDHHADQDRDRGLADLPQRDQRDRAQQAAPLAAYRAPDQRARRRRDLLRAHAGCTVTSARADRRRERIGSRYRERASIELRVA